MAGGGWSGSIGGGGFSGELTYFHPMSSSDESSSKATFTLHYDYTFSNSLNLQFETLYNGFGSDDLDTGLGDLLFLDSSPTNLFPTKIALFGSGGFENDDGMARILGIGTQQEKIIIKGQDFDQMLNK